MKIYPSNHVISAKEKTTPRDIPLAYLENSEVDESLRIDYNPEFIKTRRKIPVNIYQKFSDPDTVFFDANGKRTDVVLKRVGQEYMYSPDVTEFTPESFTWKAILSRSGKYDASVQYNMRIGMISGSIISDTFANDLISIFSDAAKRNLCPSNIHVNNNSEDANSLINMSYKNCDILFVGSSNGTGSIKINDNETISINDLLDYNCNIWMAVDSFSPLLQKLPDIKNEDDNSSTTASVKCALKTSLLYHQEAYTLDQYPYYFDTTSVHLAYPLETFEYINLFVGTCPILLLKKKNAGFIIICEKDFLADITKNVKLIYEILMYVYLNSYCHTTERTSWITDAPVDYYLNLNNKYGQNHPTISLSDSLRQDNISLKQALTLSTVVTSSNVDYLGVDNRSHMFFSKKTYTDPTIPNGTSTILSENNTVLLCNSSPVITTIEEKINLTYRKTATGYTLIIQPYKNSYYKISTEYMELPLYDNIKDYVLYLETNAMLNSNISTKKDNMELYIGGKDKYDDNVSTNIAVDGSTLYINSRSGSTIESKLKLEPKRMYMGNGVKIADISIVKKSIIKTYDLRQLGGGEASSVVNYEMIDEGNILGRPYRRGGVLIVKLPKRYESYKNLIQAELDKNINSGSLPILVFEGN